MCVFDRPEGGIRFTRFKMSDGNVSAQEIERRFAEDSLREFVKSPNLVVARLVFLREGVAAHLWRGNVLCKLGEYDCAEEAFEAVCRNYDAARNERVLHG